VTQGGRVVEPGERGLAVLRERSAAAWPLYSLIQETFKRPHGEPSFQWGGEPTKCDVRSY
jgi:hypothetical protein